MIQNVVTQEQLNASLVTSNNKQFDFEYDAENDEYGYMLDGEFHPFGNPYLRFNEDTGYVQAMTSDGNWVDLYYASELPLSSFVLYDSNVWANGYSLGSTANINSSSWWVIDGGWSNTTSGLMSYISSSASNHAYHDTSRINGSINLTQFNKINVTLTVGGSTSTYSTDISDLNGIYYLMITHFGVSSGSKEGFNLSISTTNSGYVDNAIRNTYATFTLEKQTVYINKIWFSY